MKKIVMRQTGEPEVLEVIEAQEPGVKDHEVLIDIRATGLNWSEVMIRRGEWPIEISAGFCPGAEGVGIVEKTGKEVHKINPGDRVAVLDIQAYHEEERGCYAEKTVVPQDHALKLPDGIDFPEAAAVPMALMTAYDAMINHSPLPESGTVVVTACSGAVGIAAMQIAKRKGLRVIGTTRSDKKKSGIADLGGEAVVARDPEEMKEKIAQLVKSDGVDYIFDPVSGETAGQLLSLLNGDGTYVGYGFLGGNEFTVPGLFLFHQMRIHGYVVLRNLADPKALQAVWDEAIPLIETRDIVIPLHKTFPLEDAARAHREMESHKHWGKLVLVQ
ncbi:hypothetical protein UZ36_06265 [Candidatus Nitromaritima sp. SCGC AAA799-C22]|nr:hypothetical protein UZ36_06265 [Candidatus Nitromaritima sp. SCGC AAA799-C22]